LSVEASKTLDERRGFAVRAFHLVVKEPPKPKSNSTARHKAALAALSWARPLVALSPDASSHLPDPIVRAGMARVVVGPPDSRTIAETIRIVTGESVREAIEPELAAHIGLVEIGIAVRFDRSAAECASRLRRLASVKFRDADSRDLTLDEMHGMAEAVAWGNRTRKPSPKGRARLALLQKGIEALLRKDAVEAFLRAPTARDIFRTLPERLAALTDEKHINRDLLEIAKRSGTIMRLADGKWWRRDRPPCLPITSRGAESRRATSAVERSFRASGRRNESS
jgi:hypothetical protein